MKPLLMRQSTANLSRQKKESFKLKTGLLKLASLRIRKKKPWRKRTEPEKLCRQHGLHWYMQDGSPQEGRKGQRGYMKNWSETSKTDKEGVESLHLRGSTTPRRQTESESHSADSVCQIVSQGKKAARSDLPHQELLNGTNSWFLRKPQRPKADCGMQGI